MAHTHGSTARVPVATQRLLAVLVAPFLLATAIGVVALWPGDVSGQLAQAVGAPDDLLQARVESVDEGECPGTLPEDGVECRLAQVQLLEGPDEDRDVAVDVTRVGDVSVGVGDEVVLSFVEAEQGSFRYAFADFDRRRPLAVLGLLFVGAVLLLGRLQGLRALVGTVVSLGVLAVFVLPAVLEGAPPLAVALVGSALIGIIALYLSHGVSARTTTAVLGTLVSLGLVGVLGAVFVELASFTGLSSEEASFLQVFSADVDLRGLLLGGIVIGALGVLDDVTVTQVSAVWELAEANPGYDRRRLYRSALRIGRDHIASTVNTLVLAYAGASLPLLLLFTQLDQGLVDVLNSEVVATEVVRTLAGSIGLVASVPLTTALAVAVATSSGEPEAQRWSEGPQ